VTPLETELQHLLNLMAEPYRENWETYCLWKAKGLAKHYPEDYAELPSRLKKAMQSDSNASGRNQPSTTNPRRNE
jgi:hypothetical protein